jgi:hypothetical protein
MESGVLFVDRVKKKLYLDFMPQDSSRLRRHWHTRLQEDRPAKLYSPACSVFGKTVVVQEFDQYDRK